MANSSAPAQVNIHLRAKAYDRALIDQAAGLVGSNRSQFMLASALKEAKSVLADQTTLHLNAKAFNEVMDWLDRGPSEAEAEGMRRLKQAKAPWPRER